MNILTLKKIDGIFLSKEVSERVDKKTMLTNKWHEIQGGKNVESSLNAIDWTEFDTYCWICGEVLIIKKKHDKLREEESKKLYPHYKEQINDEKAYMCDDCWQIFTKWLKSLNRCPKCNDYLIDFTIEDNKVHEECGYCVYSQIRKTNDYWDLNTRTWKVLKNKEK